MTVHNLDPTLGEMELMGALDQGLIDALDGAAVDGWRSITRDEIACGDRGEFTVESIALFAPFFGEDWVDSATYHMVMRRHFP